MKLNAYVADFSMVVEEKEGFPPKVKNCGSVRFLVLGDYNGSLAGFAYKRANREQLDCNRVNIRRENK